MVLSSPTGFRTEIRSENTDHQNGTRNQIREMKKLRFALNMHSGVSFLYGCDDISVSQNDRAMHDLRSCLFQTDRILSLLPLRDERAETDSISSVPLR